MASTTLKGTRTEKNLLIAFAGESQARNRYSFFASKAKDEGYQAIGKIFLETAEQEREHGVHEPHQRQIEMGEGGGELRHGATPILPGGAR